jgi:2-polyprenyl-3-methyl-5-hydroxy-6-metoxy-1,4-benzoquinol methylase
MKTKYGGVLSPFLRRRRMAAVQHLLVGRVLDVGCAEGHLAQFKKPDDYVGVDLEEGILAEARRKWPAPIFLGVDDLGADERFDTVVALAVIEHVSDPESWLRRWCEHLRPGGRVVLTTPHARWEPLHGLAAKVALTSDEAHEEHETTFDEESFTKLIDEVGLTLSSYERFLGGMNQLVIATR